MSNFVSRGVGSWAALSCAMWALAGCGAEPGTDGVDEISQALTTVLSENFDATPLGPLGAPWSISGGGASTITVEAFSGHGRVARLDGDTVSNFLIASRGFSASATTITSTVQIRPNSGSSFIYTLTGAGSSIGRRRIRLQRAPGSNTLVANTVPGGDRPCGSLASGVWSTVTLTVHAATFPHTFDVTVNGVAGCTASETGLSSPFTGVQIMDAGNEGWGGRVRFDNILVTTP
jgi:hypothetical protein